MKLSVVIAACASLAIAAENKPNEAPTYRLIGYRANNNMTSSADEVNTVSEATAKLMTRKITINVDHQPVRIARAMNGTATVGSVMSSREEAKSKKAIRRALVKENRAKRDATPTPPSTPTPVSTPSGTPTPTPSSSAIAMTIKDLVDAADDE